MDPLASAEHDHNFIDLMTEGIYGSLVNNESGVFAEKSRELLGYKYETGRGLYESAIDLGYDLADPTYQAIIQAAQWYDFFMYGTAE